MAKFTITYSPDGSVEKRLDFFGKEYICRQSPYVNGVSRILDDAISDQLENTDKYSNGILEIAYDAFDDMMGDPQAAVVELTEVENRHA